jgi:hypothetical protein
VYNLHGNIGYKQIGYMSLADFSLLSKSQNLPMFLSFYVVIPHLPKMKNWHRLSRHLGFYFFCSLLFFSLTAIFSASDGVAYNSPTFARRPSGGINQVKTKK